MPTTKDADKTPEQVLESLFDGPSLKSAEHLGPEWSGLSSEAFDLALVSHQKRAKALAERALRSGRYGTAVTLAFFEKEPGKIVYGLYGKLLRRFHERVRDAARSDE